MVVWKLLGTKKGGQTKKPNMCGECQTYRVDLVDSFASLVTLPSHPVAVEVGTDPVEDFAGETVILPLLRVKLQHTLVH